MIEILSYGNLIQDGKYNIHSVFENVVNFSNNDDFIFLVNKNIGPGPINLMLDIPYFDKIKHITISSNNIYLDDKIYFFDKSKLYSNNLKLKEYNSNRFKDDLVFFEELIKTQRKEKSLLFLLDKRRENEFVNSFEKKYVETMNYAANEFLYSDYLKAVLMFKGLGPGLTPSGDDFNSGVLLALNLIQEINSVNLSSVIEDIYNSAKSNNNFSNSFLYCSYRGQFFDKFSKLVNALLISNKIEIQNSLSAISAIGHTSGIDQTIGFLFGLKRFLK